MLNPIQNGLAPTTVIFYTLFTFAAIVYSAEYGGGRGTADDPYQIWTPSQMNAIGDNPGDWGKCYKLMANIDLSAYTSFHAIAMSNPFTGTFDGNRHTISNLTITQPFRDLFGLFCSIGPGGQVLNLGLEHVTINGRGDLGGLAGRNNGTITACYVTGTVRGSESNTGGLAGLNQGTIRSCFATATVSGKYETGGLVGRNEGTMTACYAAGTVSGSEWDTGGLVGRNYGTITACYSTGTVSGKYEVGGLAGDNWNGTIKTCYSSSPISGIGYVGGLAGSNTRGTIMASYATGTVDGSDRVGGLVGDNRTGTLIFCYAAGRINGSGSTIGGLAGSHWGGMPTHCFWDMQTTGQSTSACGTGKTTAEMKTQATFANAGWDFRSVWILWDGLTYPHLRWEKYHPRYSGGNGTAEDPFEIATVADWQEMMVTPGDWGKHFVMTADLDFRDRIVSLIGRGEIPFSGDFEGNGRRMANLTQTPFDRVDASGRIRNLHIQNADIRQLEMPVSGLARYNFGTIIHCTLEDSAITGNMVGGLVVWNYGSLTDCSFHNAVVRGIDFEPADVDAIGGLAAENYGTILRCCFEGNLAVQGGGAGLVVTNYGLIRDCYARGTLHAETELAGLVLKNIGRVVHCYAACTLHVMGWSAGLILRNQDRCEEYCVWVEIDGMRICDHMERRCLYNGEAISSFWDTELGFLYPMGNAGGEGKTTAQMQTQATFAGWDFANIWAICEGTNYPRLKWQIPKTDWVCPDGVALEDLVYLAGRWMAGTPETVGAADADGDGKVGLSDFGIMSEYWGAVEGSNIKNKI